MQKLTKVKGQKRYESSDGSWVAEQVLYYMTAGKRLVWELKHNGQSAGADKDLVALLARNGLTK